jgi:hypothetical protein
MAVFPAPAVPDPGPATYAHPRRKPTILAEKPGDITDQAVQRWRRRNGLLTGVHDEHDGGVLGEDD